MSTVTHTWWSSLKHGGMLIAPAKLAEIFPDTLPPLTRWQEDGLRRAIVRLEVDESGDAVGALLDTVLEGILGLGSRSIEDSGTWLKGTSLTSEWTRRAPTGEAIRPQRVWKGKNGAVLPVFLTREGTRLGIGKGRRPAARVVEWLRRSDRKLGLLANGRQLRLVYAGADYEAFAEWDTSLWFEEGRPSPQVSALRILLGIKSLAPAAEGEPSPLLSTIQESRKGQAELTADLGERVRRTVEAIIQEHGEALSTPTLNVSTNDIYLAATRIAMRLVVALFAEARDLLPRENPIYHASYSLQGLRESLDRTHGTSGIDRMRNQYGAWPRILALFRLVHEGSPHEALPVTHYGGDLFAPGDAGSSDPVRGVLSIFEDPEHAPSDASVLYLLNLLCKSRVRVRQGRSSVWVETPVDFSDLSSEYVGILYEGLLDYDLRRVEGDDPVVFLALGNEPALPLSRLESMDDGAVSELVKKLKKKEKSNMAASEEDSSEDEDSDSNDEEDSTEDEEANESEAVTAPEDEADGLLSVTSEDTRRLAAERATGWALRAVAAGKMVARPRSRKPDALRTYEEECAKAARLLVKRIVLPGEWYLVRFGGTRKGSGTFYTRPQLATPTVRRTLHPLIYEKSRIQNGLPDEGTSGAEETPGRPEEILALKVCDPACGSGSFLIASLRFLTDALYEAVFVHGRLKTQDDRTLVSIVEGRGGEGLLAEEALPCLSTADDFEARLRAVLKRYVVERCLYGVDLDPLAVDLCRLSLWVETMDRELPFTFLDHKVKCGNSIVGCWFDRFRDYPALAWKREGGDKSHTRGTHFKKEEWTKRIAKFAKENVKETLRKMLRIPEGQQLFEGVLAEAVHDEALQVLARMHELPVRDTEARGEFFREKIMGNDALCRLREALDTWCSVWFWPADGLDCAPLPDTLRNAPPDTLAIVRRLSGEHRFFHWELEFPDVFASPGGGFDAVVGNPPWDIQKPNSKEFFSNHDPLYRTYGKQEALRRQEELFRGSPETERQWLIYCARFKALSNWIRNASFPFGDSAEGDETFNLGSGSDRLHEGWRIRRSGRRGYADPEHPFRHQGSADINSYKLFLEVAHALLKKGGHLGLIVPSGAYTDKGTTDLRKLFLSKCRWRWLFGIENREKIFQIHSSFKFSPVIVQKGGETQEIATAFMRRSLNDWEEAERHALAYPRDRVERFSPHSLAILEIRHPRDMAIIEKVYSNSVLLGNSGPAGWGIKYAREFDMTNDSHLFHPRPQWEARGYRPDEYGRWLLGKWRQRVDDGAASTKKRRGEMEQGVILSRDGTEWIDASEIEDIALPLYEGRMIGQFDFSEKGWVSGKGRSAVWRDIPWGEKVIEPQYLMSALAYEDNVGPNISRIGFMAIGSSTNSRSMISSHILGSPCGNSISILQPASASNQFALLSILNSFSYDFLLRARMGGINLNYFVIEETPLIPEGSRDHLSLSLLRLNLPHIRFADEWNKNRYEISIIPWRRLWAVTPHERLRLRCILDAVVAELYGLSWDDLAWILRDCDWPVEKLAEKSFSRMLDPKGFWRVDKEREPELRHTVLTLDAFRDLKVEIAATGNRDTGIPAFLSRNGGEGWMLPETLRLNDLGMGRDERAKDSQPVRERMGERFLPWQLEQTAEESWKECELHARNLLGTPGVSTGRKAPGVAESRMEYAVAGKAAKSGSTPGNVQGMLFEDDQF